MLRPLLCCLVLAACASSRIVTVRHPDRMEPAASGRATTQRRAADSGKVREIVQQSVLAPLRSLFDSPGIARKLMGMRAEAYNVTATDEIERSDWYVAGDRDAVAESLDVPDTTARWVVTAASVQGDEPVIAVRDARGTVYWLTFDAPGHPEVATATEVISARLYRSAGYHVPTVVLMTFNPERQFEIPDTGKMAAAIGRIPRHRDGRARAAVHRVSGRPLGQFSFAGHRSDDPADTVPHEHRRELRGLYVVAAWLNHVGLFRGTTLDMAVDSADGGGVRHYLAGFASSLGFGRPPRLGTEADWDAGKVITRFLTLGFYAAPWERAQISPFDPGRWTPRYPNPAFARRTVRDGFWGAKVVAAVTEDRVRAAVAAGGLSDSVTAAALLHGLLSRRALTMRYWFARVTPLAELAIERTAEGASLRFRDLAVSNGLLAAEPRAFEVRISLPDARRPIRQSTAAAVSSDGRGALRLPPLQSAGGATQRLPLSDRVGWIDVRAAPVSGVQPRALRIYVIPDPLTAYRVVGWRY